MADDSNATPDPADVTLAEMGVGNSNTPSSAPSKARTPIVDPSASATPDPADVTLAEMQPAQQQQGGANQQGTQQDPYKGFLEFGKKLNEATQVGQSGFRESNLGHAVMDGRMSLEDAEKTIDSDERLKWMSNDVDQYEKDSWKNWATGIPTSIGVETAKALPYIAATTAAFGGGFGLVGGATAATGVGAPVALGTGTLGGLATSGGWATDYITGQDYLRRRRAGASDGEAKTWAGINGLGQGLLQSLQFKSLANVPVNAAKVPLEMARPMLVKAMLGFGKYAAGQSKMIVEQLGIGEAGTAAKLMTDALEGTVHKHANMVPNIGEAAKEFGDTFKSTVASSIALHAAGHVGGKVAGFTGQKFLQTMQKAHDAHMDLQAEKVQSLQEKAAGLKEDTTPMKVEQESTSKRLQGHVTENTKAAPSTDRSKVDAAESKLADTEQKLQDMRDLVKQIRSSDDFETNPILQDKFEKGKAKVAELVKQRGADRRDHFRARAELEGMSVGELKKAEDAEYLKNLKDDHAQTTKDRQFHEDYIEATNKKIEQIEGDYSNAKETQRDNAEKAAQDAEDARKAKEQEVHDLSARIEQINSDYQTAAEKIKQSDKGQEQLQALQGKLDQVESDYAAAKQKQKDLASNLKGKVSDYIAYTYDEASPDTPQQKADLDQAKAFEKKANKLHQEYVAKKKEIKGKMKAVEDSQPKASAIKKSVSQLYKERDAQLDPLESRLDDATSEMELHQDRVKYHKGRIEKLNKERKDDLGPLKQKRDQAKESLKAAKDQEAEMGKEIAQIEKENHKEALTRLKGVVSKIESPKQNGQTNSRLERGTDIQNVLNKVKEFIEEPGKVTVAKYDYENHEKQGYVPPDVQRDHDIAKFVGDVPTLTTEQLNKLSDGIEAALAEGKAGRLKELADAAEARHQLVKDVITGLLGNTRKGYKLQGEIEKLEAAAQPVPQELKDQLAREKAKTAVSSGPNPPEKKFKVPHVASKMVSIFGNWGSIIKTVFRNSADRDKFVERLGVSDILNGIDAAHRENMKTLFGHLTKDTGLSVPEVTELLRKGADPGFDRLLGNKGTITIDIGGQKSTITINQAMDKLAQWQDPEAREALMAGNEYTPENAFTDSTAEQIERKLDSINPAYNKIWKGYVKSYKEIYPRLDNEYFAKTGEHLPSNPYYSGPMIHLKASKELMARDFNDMLDQGAKNQRNGIITPGTTKARTGDVSALAYQDIHSKFKNYSSQTENWIGWRKPTAETFNPIMRSPEVNTVLKNKFGPDVVRALHATFEDMVFGNADKKNDLDRFLDKYVFGNVPFSVLAGKPPMFVKHVISTGNGARYIPVHAYIKGMSEFYSGTLEDVIARYKEISQTKEFQARHGDSNHEFENFSGMKAPEKMEHPWSVAMQNFFMAPTVLGVKSEAAQYWAISKYHMDQGLPTGEAMAKADAAINESQVSGRSDTKAAWARSGTLGKLLFSFQSQVNSQALDVMVSWDRLAALPTKDNFVDALKASTGAAVTTAIFECTNAAYQYYMAKDDKERNDAALDFVIRPLTQAVPFLGFPVLRDVERNMVAGGLNMYAVSQGDPAPFSIQAGGTLAGTFVKGGTALYEDASHEIKDPNWIAEHFFKALYDASTLASPKFKMPLGPTFHFADKVQQKMSE